MKIEEKVFHNLIIPEMSREELVIRDFLKGAIYWKDKKDYEMSARYFGYIKDVAYVFECECFELKQREKL